MDLNLCTIDWVAVGAIATATVTIVTYSSLRFNKQQLHELKRQFREANRPIIIAYLEQGSVGEYYIVLRNIGGIVADNIQIQINEDYLQSMKEPLRIKLNKVISKPIRLLPKHSKSLFFTYSNSLPSVIYPDKYITIENVNFNRKDLKESFEELCKNPFTLTLQYDEFCEKHELFLDEAFSAHNHTWEECLALVATNLGAISNSLKSIDKDVK